MTVRLGFVILAWICESETFSSLSLNWNTSKGFIIMHFSADSATSPDKVAQSFEYDVNFTTSSWACRACFRQSLLRTFRESGALTKSTISSRTFSLKYSSARSKSFTAWLSWGINSFTVLISTLSQTNPTEQILTKTRHTGITKRGYLAIPSPNQPKKISRRRTNQLQNDDHSTHGL